MFALSQKLTVPPHLSPGDADQNLKYDKLDLVQVLQRGKYLTGQPATWGDGDWDGGPGGSPGNPPDGDGRFDPKDIVASLMWSPGYLGGRYAAISRGGVEGDEQTSIIYNATTGEIVVDAPASRELTSINIDSAAGIFTGGECRSSCQGCFFTECSDDNIFKATFGGSFGSLSFGNVAQPGLSADFVANDLTVVGSLAGGGDLDDVDLIYVPEPSAVLLLLLGVLTMFVSRRRS